MTIKQLYSSTFEDAVTTLCYESNYYITSIEIIKDCIKDLIDKDNFVWAEHLIVALNNTDAYYYEYDFSTGTFETPKPLTEIKDLKEYCDDYNVYSKFTSLESVLYHIENEYEIILGLDEVNETEVDKSYQYLITIIEEAQSEDCKNSEIYNKIIEILDDLSIYWIDALYQAKIYLEELGV